MNVWERKQDPLCKLNFEVRPYLNPFSPSPSNYGLVHRYLSKGELARLLLNQTEMPNWQDFIVAIDEQ